MLNAITAVSDAVNWVVEQISILLMCVITALTFVGVLTRYIFNLPIIWLYESTMVAFVWTVFLGISIAFKRREHICLDLLMNALPARVSRLLQIVVLLLTSAFLVFAVKEGMQVVRDTATEFYHTIHLSTGWFYAAFPVCAAISLLHLVNEISRLLWDHSHDA